MTLAVPYLTQLNSHNPKSFMELLTASLITHVEECQIIDSRFDTSPWGSGINVTHSSDVSISNCEIARNALNGIRAADSRNMIIAGNLLEGNDGSGILFDRFVEGSDLLDIQDNTSHYNGEYGIILGHVIDGIVRNNILAGNGKGDKY